jgi:DNA-binding transcriptional regulator/RsmH inhibitor MraZ
METKIKAQIQLIKDIELDMKKLKRFKLEAERELERMLLENMKQLKIDFSE